MNGKSGPKLVRIGTTVLVMLTPLAGAEAADPAEDATARLEALKQELAQQTRRLEELKQNLAEQEASLAYADESLPALTKITLFCAE